MTSIILDCDPGHDDAMAILLALGNPNIDLLGVTTVGGNQSLEKVTYNARATLEMAHATNIPVHAGCDRPMIRPLEVAAAVHGETGLDGVTLPKPTRPLDEGHAVNWIVNTIMNSEPGTITLVPTGPLTNIAMAVRMEPRIVSRVKEVVLMGGGYHVGNWSAVAEFNIKTDPEAAHVVFNEDWPITMVGLDLTHQALCTPQVQAKIDAIGTPLSAFASGLMDFFRKAYQNNQDFIDPPVHDPCTVAYLIDHSVVQTRRCPLDVEIKGDLTLGMTVADLRGPEPSASECHTQVATKLDFNKFWDLIIDALKRIDGIK
ncbi:nucleoside hydrolase [Gardnerella vaginalis]|uniref:Putative cytidine/uridine-specific hydrolase n=1 Tax=Gardnerella vaginalis TaxID=2702 RepID=A0A133NPC8_GARVA|nr:nucleoside hydrolase [Gardnerella vaginalis]KXA18159.1 putative cytidine/uridine-specific hydrolase [Gardnerella vaginalis]MDK7192766.1 nucleoside hydrolase [Bifidobacterium sp. UMB1197]